MQTSREKPLRSVRTRVVLVMTACFLLLFALVYGVFYLSALRLAGNHEDDNLNAQVTMARQMLMMSVERLPGLAREWATLPYTYDYATGESDVIYRQHFLPHEAYERNRVNLLAVLDEQGRTLFEKHYDYVQKQEEDAPQGLADVYALLGGACRSQYEAALTGGDEPTGAAGFTRVGGQFYYFSAYPIGHAAEGQATPGTLVFGRRIDAEALAAMSREGGERFSVVALAGLGLTPSEQETITREGEVVQRDATHATAYGAFGDLEGSTSLAVAVSTQRTIYQQGRSFAFLNIMALTVVGLVILGVVVYLLDRFLLHPLESLSKRVDALDVDKGEEDLPPDDSNRELHGLTGAINGMLARMRADRALVKKQNKSLYHSANYDALTGLRNRGSLNAHLEKAVAGAHEAGTGFTLFNFDLDRFKFVNDTMGHTAGDQLLEQLSGRMRIRLDPACVLARISGDQFMVVSPKALSLVERQYQADTIFGLFSTPFTLRQRQVSITACIGSSTYPDDGQDADTLSKNSEIAMYHAKDLGEGLYVPYEHDLQNALQRRIRVENRLRSAIKSGCEAFAAYFQPKLCAEDGTITRCEALMRWIDPDEGIIAPMDFIPQAEESGLIVPLTWWMMGECCRQGSRFAAAGRPTSISINVPGQVLTHEDFLPVLRREVEATGMDIRLLDIEITESTLLEDVDKVNDVLRQLHALGCEISVDDFGTGYSSLSYLNRLAVDRIKIDRSFVQGIEEDEDSRSIVRAIVAMGQSLKMVTTAEGVETTAQYDFLCDVGCEEIQGFLVAYPMPANEYLPFLEGWTPEALRCAQEK